MPKNGPTGYPSLPFQRETPEANTALSGFWEALREIQGHWELLGLLVRRELKAATRTAASDSSGASSGR